VHGLTKRLLYRLLKLPLAGTPCHRQCSQQDPDFAHQAYAARNSPSSFDPTHTSTAQQKLPRRVLRGGPSWQGHRRLYLKSGRLKSVIRPYWRL
jgi:hypothetical protein